MPNCPFCGAPAKELYVSGSYGYYSAKDGVGCDNEKCKVKPKVFFDNAGYDWTKREHTVVDAKALARAAWSQRT